MASINEIKNFLNHYPNDWPTFDAVAERFPSKQSSNLHTALSNILDKSSEPKLKRRAFRALNLNKEDLMILDGIKTGLRHLGTLNKYARRRGAKMFHHLKTTINKLRGLSEEDEGIRAILQEAGLLKK